MYKAKCNIYCDGKFFEKDKEYTKKEIGNLPVEDFEVIDEKAPKEAKPKSLTTKSFKSKK